jgi:hypothetical protein
MFRRFVIKSTRLLYRFESISVMHIAKHEARVCLSRWIGTRNATFAYYKLYFPPHSFCYRTILATLLFLTCGWNNSEQNNFYAKKSWYIRIILTCDVYEPTHLAFLQHDLARCRWHYTLDSTFLVLSGNADMRLEGDTQKKFDREARVRSKRKSPVPDAGAPIQCIRSHG